MKGKKIVLIGGTGRVGSQVAGLLLNGNHQVTIIARNREKLLPFESRGATIAATSVLDTDALTAALNGADTVLTMIASNPFATDFFDEQLQQANAQVTAIKNAGIKNVVNLSSNGCHVKTGNGVIEGLSEMEHQLNGLEGVNVLHLRPTFYMENTFYALDLIRHQGIYGLPIRGDKYFPMIATSDVAKVIADKLTAPDFMGKSVLPLLGPKDYCLAEIATEIGKAIGKESLPYINIPVEDFISGVMAGGGSADFAGRFAALMVATDNGLLNYHTRTAENTTPTTASAFFSSVFAAAYLHN